MELADYDLILKHKPGKENKIADALSRRPDYDTGENDNKGIVVLPEAMFIKSTTLKDPPPLLHPTRHNNYRSNHQFRPPRSPYPTAQPLPLRQPLVEG